MLTYLDIGVLVESIHLVQELQEDTLYLTISWEGRGVGVWFHSPLLTSSLGVKSLSGNSVNLVNEDDGRGILPGKSEHISNHSGTLS